MNIQQMMKQAQKMQSKMAQVQEDLKAESIETSAGGGAVKVTISGDLAVKSISIDPSLLDPEEIEMVQDILTAAVNEAIRSAQELGAQRMSEVTGGMNIPGLM